MTLHIPEDPKLDKAKALENRAAPYRAATIQSQDTGVRA
jgi:hypothetical protein